MKTLLSVFAVLGALTTAALVSSARADDAAAPTPPADGATPPVVEDCTTLEGEAKAACEAKKAESEKPPETSTEQKAGKSMNKSNDGNMESYDADE